ncbi:MAG: FtsX-like permease family protein [Chloroflexi bacterium]|nr:FtsX-like permease family protein [Chloroflexota bacterium]
MSTFAGRIAPPVALSPGSVLPFVGIVGKRLVNNPLLVAMSLFGIITATSLVTGVLMYSEAISSQGLRRELGSPSADQVMPKSALLLSYVGGRASQPLSSEAYSRVNSFVQTQASSLPGLATSQAVRYAQSDPYQLLFDDPDAGLAVYDTSGKGFVAFLQGFSEHIQILEGRSPRAGSGSENELEALMSTQGLDELGIGVGDRVKLLVAQQQGSQITIPIRVVGRWNPNDEEEPYWFNRTSYFKDAFFLSEEDFFNRLPAMDPRAIREYDWYTVFDTSKVRIADVEPLLAGLQQLRNSAQAQLRGLRVDASPEGILESYRQKSFFFKILLFVISAPILAITLQFVTSSARLVVERQGDEIATLRSRGATARSILGMYLLEWSMLGLVGIAVGPLLGIGFAQLVGQVTSFLVFGGRGVLPTRLGPDIYLFALIAAVLSISAALMPALEASSHSIVTYKQTVARALRAGFVRRYYLDLIPLPIAAYAYFLLTERRTVLPVGDAGDVFSDPLLLLAPAFFIFAVAFAFLRLFPLLVAALERVIGPLANVVLLVVLRQIARQSSQCTVLILLLTLTIGLGGFSASLAATIDRNYDDAAAYQVGADLRLGESGAYDDETQEWTMVPVGEHLSVPGVEVASRVLRLKGTERAGARGGEVNVLGVDPMDFAQVGSWRSDYAPEPLQGLLNGLLLDETGVIVDRRLMDAYKLRIGDQLTVNFKNQPVDFTITGYVDYFPTLYPDDGRFLITNIDYLFTYLGSQPYEVWAKLRPGARAQATIDELSSRDIPVVRSESLGQVASKRREDLTRVGVLGILSAGFIVATLLTTLNLFQFSYLSFRRRLQQLGILRAIGLSLRQLAAMYLVEQVLLVALGIIAGTALALVTAWIYIPFLQIKAELHAGVPPFVVVTAWGDVLKLFLILLAFFVISLPPSLWLLSRVRIHEAIKFGEERG